MAKPTPKSQSTTAKRPPSKPRQSPGQPLTVDPRWLVRTLAALVVLALFCGYLTLGLMFYLGSWQLVLHPTRDASGGTQLASEKIRFAPDGSGVPQLSGEWLAAPADSARSGYAVLYLHGADGQLGIADGTQMTTLHDLGLDVLAFDYRGYGASAVRPHPSEDRMLEDAVTAWQYLTGVRHIAPAHVVLFGSGVGVSLATQLLQNYGPGAGLIAYNADPEVLARVKRDPRSKLFPMGLVFHDRFSLDGLQHLRTPKLLYAVGTLTPASTAVNRNAADPKLTVEVPSPDAGNEQAALKRFFDSYLSGAPIPVLTQQLPTGK
jgi:pimeloyl-ACP methyl ester carboxylesterase